MADNIITGRKYRIKATENTWDLISYWTKSQDVEMDDGTNLQTSFSNLKTQADNSKTIVDGLKTIPDDAPVYDSTMKYSKGEFTKYNGSIFYANVDILVPEAWNSSHWTAVSTDIPFRFGIDAEGNYGYIKAGADSVTPFKAKTQIVQTGYITGHPTRYSTGQSAPYSYNINPANYSEEFNVKEYLQNSNIKLDYKKLTSDNFFYVVTSSSEYVVQDDFTTYGAGGNFHGSWIKGTYPMIKEYNENTGILTFRSPMVLLENQRNEWVVAEPGEDLLTHRYYTHSLFYSTGEIYIVA